MMTVPLYINVDIYMYYHSSEDIIGLLHLILIKPAKQKVTEHLQCRMNIDKTHISLHKLSTYNFPGCFLSNCFTVSQLCVAYSARDKAS